MWAVAFPRRDKFADREALPVTSNAAKGVVLPMPTLPDESILTLSLPFVEKLRVSAPLDQNPLLKL
ncbi:MAG: hypothetical protein UY42_C0032G0002 [Parcubacteria group bacterium GW2011_GWA2_49_16]|nr:MAG: hypothetical protein UY42_C0032G0002 [Parcubacteria group bacterium GW2011_GWA2_49_16]